MGGEGGEKVFSNYFFYRKKNITEKHEELQKIPYDSKRH